MITHRFLFTRIEQNRVDCAVMMALESRLENPNGILAELIKGVDAWVADTADGKAMQDYAGGTMNIGDLGSYLGDPDSAIHGYLSRFGVRVVFLEEVLANWQVSYDKVLCTTEKIE